jgi:uncharacterized membrane protein
MKKKAGFFYGLFAVIGFIIFLIILVLIILAVYFMIAYGFPAFKETITNITGVTR